jgi:hypothetical protein
MVKVWWKSLNRKTLFHVKQLLKNLYNLVIQISNSVKLLIKTSLSFSRIPFIISMKVSTSSADLFLVNPASPTLYRGERIWVSDFLLFKQAHRTYSLTSNHLKLLRNLSSHTQTEIVRLMCIRYWYYLCCARHQNKMVPHLNTETNCRHNSFFLKEFYGGFVSVIETSWAKQPIVY